MCVTMSLVFVLMGVNNIGMIQNVMVRILKRDFDNVLRTIKGVQNLQFEILDRLKGKQCLFFLTKIKLRSKIYSYSNLLQSAKMGFIAFHAWKNVEVV